MPNGICAAVDAMLLLSCRGHGARALPFGGGAGALPFGPGALPFGPGAFPFGGGGGAGGRDVRGGTPLDDTPAGCIDWSSGVKAARMPEYLGVSLVCASVGAVLALSPMLLRLMLLLLLLRLLLFPFSAASIR